MKHTAKRLLAAILVLVLTLSVGLVPALADGEDDEALELIATDVTLSENGEELEIEVVPANAETPDGVQTGEEPAEIAFEEDDVECIDLGAVMVENSPIGTDGSIFQVYPLLNGGDAGTGEIPDLSKITNTFADAAAEARDAMKKRASEFEVSFVSDNQLSTDGKVLNTEFFNEVFRHTGVPTEGDYLKWQVNGYTFQAKIYINRTTNKYYYVYNCSNLVYYDTAEQEQAVDTTVGNIISGLGIGKDSLCTDYEKIYKIYNYVTKSFKYGPGENYSGYSGYGALVKNMASCQGFTLAVYRLALEAGLDARIIPSEPADHAWNIVKVGNSYYNLDATWDRKESRSTWVYFLCGDEGHTAGQTVTKGDYSFRDKHIAEADNFASYYRPDWVSEYSIPMTDYPCFAEATHPFGSYLIELDPSKNTETSCVLGGDGHCTVCGQHLHRETLVTGTVQVEPAANLVAYADGVEVPVAENGSIELTSKTKVLTTFTFNTDDATTNYPEQQSMKVYFVSVNEEGKLVAERDESFDAIMQYLGASVRCDGNKGIRIITGIPRDRLAQLKGEGLNGWKLTEYGTLVGNREYLDSSVVFGAPKSASAKFNDNPFQRYGDNDGYTVGLTFNDMEQCKVTFSMRPYMKITNGEETVVLYGGAVLRSIGYVAWQNRNAFNPQTQPSNYAFIQEIMEYCGYTADEEQKDN